MTTTADYGSWGRYNRELHVKDTVLAVLGEFTGDFDVDAIVEDYREAINRALPEGVSLSGDEFSGPYPAPDGYREAIHAALDDVDILPIIDKHDRGDW